MKPLVTMVYGEHPDVHDRSNSWIEHAEQSDRNIILVLAAGHLPFSRKLLKSAMREYIKEQLLSRNYSLHTPTPYTYLKRNGQTLDIRLAERNGWGTFEETLLVAKELAKKGIKEITVFSSPEHLPRILSIWDFLAPDVTVTPISSAVSMDQSLINTEAAKDYQTQLFYFIYRHFGETALWGASWVKNVVLNVILNRDRQHY